MMRPFCCLFACCWLFFCHSAHAQDPHFSQYYASPLSLNPANTGFIDGPYRIALNARKQWWNVGEPYETASASMDFNFYANNPNTYDKLGLGLMVTKEESLAGVLNSTYVALSSSYHKNLADNNRHMLGFGLQVAYSNKMLAQSKLSFASQFTGKGFDRNIPVDMGNLANSASYMDINAGLLYYSAQDWGHYYAGLSVYHLTKPVETIYAQGPPLHFRNTLHGGATFALNYNVNVLLSGLYMQQDQVKDRLLGSALEFQGTSNIRLRLGLWHRIKDSVIPYAGIDFSDFSIGANYGISTPSVTTYKPQTFEISLIFRKAGENRLAMCPRF